MQFKCILCLISLYTSPIVRKREQKYAGLLKGGIRPVCTPKNYKTLMKKTKNLNMLRLNESILLK